MTENEIVEIAIQGHASTRDAIRWAIVQEREACAKLVEADGLARGEYGYMLTKAATRIRARGAFVHASDMSQERVDETAKDRQGWAMQQMVAENKRLGLYDQPKREWVGLEEEESIDMLIQAGKPKGGQRFTTAPDMAIEFGRLASERLKEKNGG